MKPCTICTMSSTFGHLFCVTNFGESHGPAIGCVIDGCPPGMALAEADLQRDLDRRRPGTSRHVTQRRESDRVEILSGVYEGHTTGTPIALHFAGTVSASASAGYVFGASSAADAAFRSDLSHTVAWGGISGLTDANGNAVAFSALSEGSGADFAKSFASPVPEPGQALVRVHPAQEQRSDPASGGHRDGQVNQQGRAGRPKGRVQQHKDQKERHRYYNGQSGARPLQILELPAPLNPVAGRELHVICYCLSRVGHKTGQIAPAHVRFHRQPSMNIFPADLGWAFLNPNLC